MNKDYYEIACDDLRYLQGTLHLPYYIFLVISIFRHVILGRITWKQIRRPAICALGS